MSKFIAVIGCGHWGKNLVRNFYELDVLASICDPNHLISNSLAKKYNVKNSVFDEILDDTNIKGVALAVPAQLHASMAIEAMNKGKHVFVEKPIALSEEEANLMIASSKHNKVQLMVGHLLHYHPIFIKIKKLIQDGDIGKLNYIYSNRLSFGKIRSNEDVIWSFAPHDISMILSLVNQEPEFISCKSSSVIQKNLADMASIHLEFKSGLKSDIRVSWLNPKKEVKLVISGEDGILIFDDDKPWNKKLEKLKYKVEINKDLSSINKISQNFIEVSETEPLKNECQHFIDVVENNIIPVTDGFEGLRVLQVLTAATKSHIKNQTLKYD